MFEPKERRNAGSGRGRRANRSVMCVIPARRAEPVLSICVVLRDRTCMDARPYPAKYAGLERRRRPRDPQRRRPGQRRRDPLPGDLLQAARHQRVVRDPPHQLRHGVLHQRRHAPDSCEQSLETAAARRRRLPRRRCRAQAPTEGHNIDWLTIADPEQSVVDDVRRIRNHPLVPSRIPIHGYIYDVTTGRLEEVAGATEAGRGT